MSEAGSQECSEESVKSSRREDLALQSLPSSCSLRLKTKKGAERLKDVKGLSKPKEFYDSVNSRGFVTSNAKERHHHGMKISVESEYLNGT